MRRADARLQRVEHDQQLHQVVVGRRAGRLEHEDVAAAHVLLISTLTSPSLKRPSRPATSTEVPQMAGKTAVRAAREYLDLVLHPSSVDFLMNRARELGGRGRTFAAGSKVRCLTSLATAQERGRVRAL